MKTTSKLMPNQSWSNGYLGKTKAPIFIVEHDVTWHRISLLSVGVSCSRCVPSQTQPTHLGAGAHKMGKGDGLDTVQVLLCNRLSTGVLPTVINPKHSTILAAVKKVTFITARPSTRTHDTILISEDSALKRFWSALMQNTYLKQQYCYVLG